MKALIIDDEPMPAKNLAQLIDLYCTEISTTEVCLSPVDALNLLKESKFDLLFLDIEMPEMTGFDFIELANLPKETKVIITTAYKQYAIEAFEARAAHYLVKPIKEKDLIKAVRRVSAELEETTKHSISQHGVISISGGNERHIIQQEDIIRLEADGSYTNCHLADATLLSSKSISFYHEELSHSLFFKPHRSHIINLKKVSKISKGKAGLIILSNGDRIPLAKSHYEELEKALGI